TPLHATLISSPKSLRRPYVNLLSPLGNPRAASALAAGRFQQTRIIGRSCPAARPTPDGVASLWPAPILEASAETLSTLMPPAVAKVHDAFAKDVAGPKYRICSSSFSLKACHFFPSPVLPSCPPAWI